jgi:DNA polymerase III alpha subunit
MMKIGSLDDISEIITAIRSETSIELLPPDVNKSNYHFKKEDDNIRYGLGSIMSLTKAANVIVEERIANGKYKSISDFIKRVPGRIVNTRSLKNLLLTNAFSDFGSIEDVMKEIEEIKGAPLSDVDLSKGSLMKTEFELLGTNVTYLDPLLKKAKEYTSFADFEEGSAKMMIRVIKTTAKKTKTGKDYLFHSVEDMNSRTQFSVFNWNKKELEVGRAIIVNLFKKGDFISVAQEFKRRY